ncbi:MAG: ATP synthase F1 subunit epsilon [Candidatus Kapabacteria bacterium]|jgi:F-type H+-transporting ATPase subunit epsilon|nr:ATP synthase F1 subunit epsilon [Candidatus Kapabacteria bacterium]
MAQDKLMSVEIVTPRKIIYSGKAVSVSVPGSKSPFQALSNHAAIMSSIDLGIVKIADDSNKTLLFATGTGFVEIINNKVSLLVETATEASSIDMTQAEADHDEAYKNFKAADKVHAAELSKILAESDNMLKAAKKFQTIS